MGLKDLWKDATGDTVETKSGARRYLNWLGAQYELWLHMTPEGAECRALRDEGKITEEVAHLYRGLAEEWIKERLIANRHLGGNLQ